MTMLPYALPAHPCATQDYKEALKKIEDDAKAERTKLEDKVKTMIEEVKKKIPT